MRHGRAKAARKTLQFFARQGVEAPYVVLVDGTFLVHSVQMKVPIVDRIEKLLQHNKDFSLQVTRSALNELDVLLKQQQQLDDGGESISNNHNIATSSSKRSDILQQAKQWGLDECDIVEPNQIPTTEEDVVATMTMEEEAELGIPAQDIVKLVVQSQSRRRRRSGASSSSSSFVVATQDEVLLDVLRTMGQCPLMRLSRGVLLLEHPSKAAIQRAQYEETAKYNTSNNNVIMNDSERRLAKSVAEEQEKEEEEQRRAAQQNLQRNSATTTRVKRKAKGPNPLSCKRKKTTEHVDGSSNKQKRRRRRRGNKHGDDPPPAETGPA